jgi:hypothetical protein
VDAHHAKLKERGPRHEIVGARKRLGGALQRLLRELERGTQFVDDLLPDAALCALGEMVSDCTFERVANRRLPPVELPDPINCSGLGLAKTVQTDESVNFNTALGAAKPISQSISLADVERHFVFERQTRGLKHGVRILAHIVKRIDDPLTEWLELNRQNKGGSPTDHVRWLMVMALADYAEKILKIRVTGTAKGKFMDLCADVFQAMKLTDDGLEEAVGRILAERRQRLKKSPRQ